MVLKFCRLIQLSCRVLCGLIFFISHAVIVYCTRLGHIYRAYSPSICIKTMGLSLIFKTKVHPVTARTVDWLLVVYLLVGLLIWVLVRVVGGGGWLLGWGPCGVVLASEQGL